MFNYFMIKLVSLSPEITLVKEEYQIELIGFLFPVFRSIVSHLKNHCSQSEKLLIDCTNKVFDSYCSRLDDGLWIIRLKGWGDPYHTPFMLGHELCHYFIRSTSYIKDRTLLIDKVFPIEEVMASIMGEYAISMAQDLYQHGQFALGLAHVTEQKMVRSRLIHQAIEGKYGNLGSVPLVEPISGNLDYVNIELLAFCIFPIFQEHPRLWEILPNIFSTLTLDNNPTWDVFLNQIKRRVGVECQESIDVLLNFLYS